MEGESPKLQKGSHNESTAGEVYASNRTPKEVQLKKIRDVLARVPLFRDARWEDIKLETLDSFTILNYKVTTNDEIYVLRIAGKGTSRYIDRAAEKRNTQIATAAGSEEALPTGT